MARHCRWRRVSSSKSPSRRAQSACAVAVSGCRPVSRHFQQLRYHSVDGRADDGTRGSDLLADIDRKAGVGSIGNAIELAADENRQVGAAFAELAPELRYELQGDAII